MLTGRSQPNRGIGKKFWLRGGDVGGWVVTSSGVSAGIDMTLAVISRLYGDKVGEWLELVTEYDAHRNPAWDPFARKAGLVK